MPTQKKIDSVKSFEEKLSKAKSVIFTDYRGLTHKQLEDLRKALKKEKAEFVVFKNTLIKIAIEKNDNLKKHAEGLRSALNNPTAVLLSFGDQITPLKELAKFIKGKDLPKIKLGVIEDKVITGEQVLEAAKLPAREVLIGKLVGTLNSPIYNLHWALSGNLRKLVFVLNQVAQNKK